MSDSKPLSIRDREEREQLDNLNAADRLLRANLHMHGVNPTAREHLERALNHIREGYIAIQEPGRSRSVKQFVEDSERTDRLLAHLSSRKKLSHITLNIG